MINTSYNLFLRKLLESDIDFDSETFKVLLVTDGYKPNSFDTMKEITPWEISSLGYEKGGKSIALSIDETGTKIKADSPVKWNSLTAKVRYAIVYQVATENIDDIPIICQDLIGVRNLNNSKFILDWEDYLLELTQSPNGPLINYSGILGLTRLGTTILGGLGIEEASDNEADS